jgi:hypothetical protein
LLGQPSEHLLCLFHFLGDGPSVERKSDSIRIPPFKVVSVKSGEKESLILRQAEIRALHKPEEQVKSRRDILRGPTHVSLECFFQREMREEEPVPYPPNTHQLLGDLPVFFGSSSPVCDLRGYVNHLVRAFATAASFVFWEAPILRASSTGCRAFIFMLMTPPPYWCSVV